MFHQSGNTALMGAAEKGHVEVVMLLLAAGATKEVRNKVSLQFHCC
jgi:ankyrin repeat protein